MQLVSIRVRIIKNAQMCNMIKQELYFMEVRLLSNEIFLPTLRPWYKEYLEFPLARQILYPNGLLRHLTLGCTSIRNKGSTGSPFFSTPYVCDFMNTFHIMLNPQELKVISAKVNSSLLTILKPQRCFVVWPNSNFFFKP